MSDENETPGDRASDPLTFTDSSGVTWDVRRITPGPMPPKLLQLLREDRRVGGWLLFLSREGEKRRLSPVPQEWPDVSPVQLEQWCGGARRVPPAPERRAVDRSPPTSD
jgi:hypothetical protein